MIRPILSRLLSALVGIPLDPSEVGAIVEKPQILWMLWKTSRKTGIPVANLIAVARMARKVEEMVTPERWMN